MAGDNIGPNRLCTDMQGCSQSFNITCAPVWATPLFCDALSMST